jgi:ribulose-phosphate 3-epimerase
MVSNPDQLIQHFVRAGADTVHIHIESECNVLEVLEVLRNEGVRVGITINPDTPVDMVYPVMKLVDEVLVMSVYPGFGGQKFIPDALARIRSIRDYAKANDMAEMDIMVDGGINFETGRDCAAHGANKFVAGNFLYTSKDMKEAVTELRKITTEAFVL